MKTLKYKRLIFLADLTGFHNGRMQILQHMWLTTGSNQAHTCREKLNQV